LVCEPPDTNERMAVSTRRELLRVEGAEPIGLYMLLRLERGDLDPGAPGQFFMLEAPGRLLPRALSLCLAPPGELAFLIDPVGAGTEALCEREPGDEIHVFGPLGNGFRLDVERPLLVGGGIGMAPLPYLAEVLRFPPAVLGFRSAAHAEAAALLPGAELAIDPQLVTELIPTGHDVLACGPEPMLHAVAERCPGAQLAWEAPMACGYGGCYGCAVEIDGELKRLCVEGPVLVSSGQVAQAVSPAITRRAGASSAAPAADTANAACVLPSLGARDRDDVRHLPGEHRAA
jgi:dihydroorotate dehydrogenase electron transfer subunit